MKMMAEAVCRGDIQLSLLVVSTKAAFAGQAHTSLQWMINNKYRRRKTETDLFCHILL